jgi:hypothetical protein
MTDPAENPSITDAQLTKLNVLLGEAGLGDRADALAWISGVLGIGIESRKDLTKDEASRLIDMLADGGVRRQEIRPLGNDAAPVQEAVRRVMYDIGQIGVGKGGTNTQQNYRFRGVDQFVDSLSPILARHGVILLPNAEDPVVTEHPTARGGTQFMVIMGVNWEIVGPRGDVLHARTIGQAMDASDKASNKAMSAAFKYALAQVFAIPNAGWTEGDADNPTVDTAPGFNRNSQPRPEPRQNASLGPTHEEIMARLGEFARNQSMSIEQFTERFRGRHNNITVDQMREMPREMLLAFLRQVEDYQHQTQGAGSAG